MSENRLPDYLDHIQQAATDARSFVEGMAKDDFLADKRTQQAVIMSLIVIGEAATKVMDGYVEFTQAHADVPWRSMRNMRNRMAHGYFDINLDVVWETVQEWLPALLQQLPAVRQMPTMKTVTTTVKEGSPMTVESRIFSVAEYVQPSEGEPIRSVVLETRDSIIVVWHVHPGQEIAAHIHPHGQDTWTVLSGMADYFQGNGIVRALREGEIAVARPGQVHGARNTGTEPFVLVSVVASANAGFVLLSDRAQSLELVQ
jgi:uncharacterized protein with HEPN domain/quercetin dioxygenase-like cupin family protein